MTQRYFSQTFGVVGGLLVRDGRVLLVQQSKGVDKGKWNQPAGWPEVGEDLVAAAQREVGEETGYTFTPTHLLGVYSLVRSDLTEHLQATPHPIKLIFLGDISDTPTRPLFDDVDEARWFTFEEIEQMDGTLLRDIDVKKMVQDYRDGKNYPLDIVRHTVSTSGK